MSPSRKTIVMKFGGAAVQEPDNFSLLSDLIIDCSKNYPQIVIVVSAMGDMTDHLVSLAHQIHPNPPQREYDMLVSVGERISISLLAMALARKGREAVSFTGSQSGIITTSHHTAAQILDVRPARLIPHLEKGRVVIVAGFQGVSLEKEITTLGRGGSDTTAVALAVALKAEKVEFYKDVAGIFTEDPKKIPSSSFHSSLSYEEAETIIRRGGDQVLHARAILLAKKNFIPLHVRPFYDLEGQGTFISSSNPQLVSATYEL